VEPALAVLEMELVYVCLNLEGVACPSGSAVRNSLPAGKRTVGQAVVPSRAQDGGEFEDERMSQCA
jgi:hypothetical protein